MNNTEGNLEWKQIYILISLASRVCFDVLLWHFGLSVLWQNMRNISIIPDNSSTCSRHLLPISILRCHSLPFFHQPAAFHPSLPPFWPLAEFKRRVLLLFPYTHLVFPRSISTYAAWIHPYLSRLQSVFFFFIPLLRDSTTFSRGSFCLLFLPGWEFFCLDEYVWVWVVVRFRCSIPSPSMQPCLSVYSTSWSMHTVPFNVCVCARLHTSTFKKMQKSCMHLG